MGLPQKSLAYIEPEEYLALEAVAKEKHEYMDGVILAWQGYTVRGMAGASANHNRISLNLATGLRNALQGSDCEVFAGDMRLRPREDNTFFYPDLLVRCGAPLSGELMETNDARLVIEILSPTTEGFDRNDKFARYREMTTLESYVLVDPPSRRVEVFRRAEGWVRTMPVDTRQGPSSVPFGALDLVLPLDQIFAGVT